MRIFRCRAVALTLLNVGLRDMMAYGSFVAFEDSTDGALTGLRASCRRIVRVLLYREVREAEVVWWLDCCVQRSRVEVVRALDGLVALQALAPFLHRV